MVYSLVLSANTKLPGIGFNKQKGLFLFNKKSHQACTEAQQYYHIPSCLLPYTLPTLATALLSDAAIPSSIMSTLKKETGGGNIFPSLFYEKKEVSPTAAPTYFNYYLCQTSSTSLWLNLSKRENDKINSAFSSIYIYRR